jgi:hypothetical protein
MMPPTAATAAAMCIMAQLTQLLATLQLQLQQLVSFRQNGWDFGLTRYFLKLLVDKKCIGVIYWIPTMDRQALGLSPLAYPPIPHLTLTPTVAHQPPLLLIQKPLLHSKLITLLLFLHSFLIFSSSFIRSFVHSFIFVLIPIPIVGGSRMFLHCRTSNN